MGLLVSAILYPVVSPSRRHKAIVWGLRVAAIPVSVVLMVVLIRNFYTGDPYAGRSDLYAWYPNSSLTPYQHALAVGTFRAFLPTLTITAKGELSCLTWQIADRTLLGTALPLHPPEAHLYNYVQRISNSDTGYAHARFLRTLDTWTYNVHMPLRTRIITS